MYRYLVFSFNKLPCGRPLLFSPSFHSFFSPITMLLKYALVTAASFSSSALAAFGVTKSGSNFIVDAGSSNALVFTVNGANCDITSIKYRGEEFQYASKGSHISSGLGSAEVSSAIIGSSSHPLVRNKY